MTDQDGGQMKKQDPSARADQIRTALASVRERVDRATRTAGREQAPEIVVVTKFHPVEDVRVLAELGIRAVGENRDQEARAKAAEVEDLDLEWHFVGQLQTNKAKYVVRYAAAVQSVDRPELVDALAAAMGREQDKRAAQGTPERDPLDCLIQVDLDPRPEQERPAGIGARGGVHPDGVLELAAQIDTADHLRLRGVMAVAPRGMDPAGSFTELAEISHRVRQRFPDATWISAGMSSDLEQAVAAGATHLRIGTDVLGPRPAVG